MPIALIDLRRRLHEASDPVNAAAMSSYMRDRFHFLGVKTPERRVLSKSMVAASKKATVGEVLDVVDELRGESEREFHYVASDVLRANDRRLPAEAITGVERWITTDSWWDTVDAIASPTVGTMVLGHHEVAEQMDVWIGSDNIWLARTALIHQLRFGEATDADRLFRYVELRADDGEFFIRKAIGWALRQFARSEPDMVRAFVAERTDRLSPLSVREATKHLG